jgi:cbb3-type cytochrome oxidase maturation protein
VESYFFLIPIALIFVVIALRLLFWAINSGQYDNLDTEAHRILFDEDNHDISPAAEKPAADTNALPNPPTTIPPAPPGKHL